MRARHFVFGDFGISRNRQWAQNILVACLTILLGFAATPVAIADSERSAKSNRIVSQDEDTPRRIAIIGDSLAQDLWNGLHKLYRENENVEIIRFTQVSTGLVRDDVYDWSEALKEFVKTQEFDIAIVLMGGNDRQPIRAKGRRLKRNTDAWKEEYANRVAKLINVLKPEADEVYWLGLPIVRPPSMARAFRRFNKIYNAQSDALGVKFIKTWSLFEDENGAYTSFGPDAGGVNRRLRKDDGMHFTVRGKLRFAQDVMEIIGQDLIATNPGLRLNMASDPSGG